MKVVATLSTPEEAQALKTFLMKAGIASEVRAVTDDNGLDVMTVMVADELYDQACTQADAWLDAALAATEHASHRHGCPHCHSTNLDRVTEAELGRTVTGISEVRRCRDCGWLAAK